MKLKKLLIGITILTLATASLAGCAKKNNGEKLSEINLTYVKSPLNVPSIIQKQDDLFGKEFKKDNIKVNFHEITTGPEQTQALAAGEIDFLHALGGTSALIAASNGVELKILNTYSRSPKGFMILHQVFISALDKEGLSMDDVEFVNMGIPEASAALSDGSVDAALIAGPAALKAMKSGSKLVANGEGLVDGIIVTAVSTDFAEKHPEIVERFMKVEKETLEYVNNNFDEAMEKVAKEVDLSLEETKELYAWYDFSLDITDKDISSLEDTQDFLIKNKLQEKKVNIKELIYNAK